MSGLATSTTKSKPVALRAYASLRFLGDRLEPERISAILGAEPTTAYRIGEIFKRSRGHEVRGRTGLWLLSTRGHIDSTDLEVHFAYLLGVLFPGGAKKVAQSLRALMAEDGLTADVGCFWYGEHGAKPPVIPKAIRAAFAEIDAVIQPDFDTD
jgi:hypothetical protein